MSIIGISNLILLATSSVANNVATKQDTAINITIPILFLVILAGTIYIWFLTRKMIEYKEKFNLSCSDYRDLSDFLARFTTGIDPSAGIVAPMNTVAQYLSDRIGAESIAIFELQDDKMLHCIGVSGSYPLVMTNNDMIFTRPQHLIEILKNDPIALGTRFLGKVAVSGVAELVPFANGDFRFEKFPFKKLICSVMAIPMLQDNNVVGVICAVNNKHKPGQAFAYYQFDKFKSMTNEVLMVQQLYHAYKQINDRSRIDQELEFARSLQLSLLPKTIPLFDVFSIAARTHSAKEVNGDFYDIINVDEDRLLIVMGDACGKGIPACMLSAMTRSFSRSLVDNFTTLTDFLKELNGKLYRDTEADRFITLGACLLDKRHHLLEFGRAGHTDMITFVHNHIRLMSPKGNALGILPARRCKYETICIALEPGTAVMLFSDGLSEATDSDKVEFGVPRLSAAFSDACNRFNDSEQIIDHVMATVQDYESEQADDQTMILIRHTKSA